MMRIELTGGSIIEARTGIAATGVHYRQLETPGVEKFVGAGVYYGSAPGEAVRLHGRDVVIVGGGNSAGQAALHMAEHARAVTVVCRSPDLRRGRSNYLVERIDDHPRIAVRTSFHIAEVQGDSHLQSVILQERGRRPDRGSWPPMRCSCSSAANRSPQASKEWLKRDSHGFLLTGQDVMADAPRDPWWRLSREPYPLESSQPGVFVAGDLRHGSIKRVASAVGEGAMAVSLIHQYLALDENQ